MTFDPASTSPLFLFPAIGNQLINYGFETAFAAPDWTAGGTSVPTRNTSVFKYGVASCKFAPVAQTSTITQTQTLAAVPGWKVTGDLEPWYVYFWARQDSGTGTFNITVISQSTGPATVESFSTNFTLGTNIVTDTTWRLYRAGPLTPTTYSGVIQMKITLGFTGSTTAVMYIDNIYLGHALDFQDLGPLSEGAELVHPFSAPKTVPTTSTRIPNGNYQTVRYNLGWNVGKVKSTIIDNSAKALITTFQDYCTDATEFTIWHDRTNVSENYYPTAIIPGGVVKDGFKQVVNMWQWEQVFEVTL